MEHRVGGWIQDPYSAKDIPFAAVATALLEKSVGVDTEEWVLPEFTAISNQGRLGSCVGNAVVDGLEIVAGLESPRGVVQLSRLHAYWLGRYYTNDTDKDEGTHIRVVCYQISQRGVCPEELWPYDDDNVVEAGKPLPPVFRSPPLNAQMAADSNLITSYYRIVSEGQALLDDIELALRANQPVVFGTVVGRQFQACRDQAVLGRPTDSLGRHAILIVGVRRAVTGRREFLIRNSWGINWGFKGHAWLDESHINWPDGAADFWVPTRMPKLIL